jgi:gas vesicle protein
MADNNEFGAFLAGFIVGGLVGAAVALVTAPQSGEETRRFITDKSIELKNTAVEKAELARTKAEAAAVELAALRRRY